MQVSGFTDEAAASLADQIAILRHLGWQDIDLRKIERVPVHDHDLDRCREYAEQLSAAEISVTSIGSAIGAGGSSLDDDTNVALDQARRCVERAPLFGARFVRIMSWPPVRGAPDRGLDEPTAAERIARLKDICEILIDGGLQPLHENCHNYGGQSPAQTLRLLEEVPQLRLVFDTGNPVATDDWSYPSPRPKQSPWQFWVAVRDYVDHLHIKDGYFDYAAPRMVHTLPGDGQGDVLAILTDAVERGFSGPVSLEPHLGGASEEERRQRWCAAGRRLTALIGLTQAS